MNRDHIPADKVNKLRRMFINGPVNASAAAVLLKINRKTVHCYLAQFEQVKKHHPSKLEDMGFFMPVNTEEQQAERLYLEMTAVLPGIISTHRLRQLDPVYIWNIYREQCPGGYAFYLFRKHFGKWCKANKIATYHTKLIVTIPDEDWIIINKWRKGSDKQKWQMAVTLDAAYHRKALVAISRKIEAHLVLLYHWIDAYRTGGLAGLVTKPNYQSAKAAAAVTQRSAWIMQLMHETPQLHGFNKTAWTTTALAAAYRNLHGSKMCCSNASRYLKRLGYTYKSSRRALTSNDPHYTEKLQKIKDILGGLENDEKFFSIDEYGPVGMKLKPGWSYMKDNEQQKTISQIQRCRGFIICIAALELSQNQVTHFFALQKTSAEIIKLVDLLTLQYKDQRTLYLSWDDVSFHKSKAVKEHLVLLNTETYRTENNSPAVELVPLPSCATFLNVIESVFVGMARSTISNSDYSGPEECKQAIERYFLERNRHFRENPKHAGNKIWGKETIVPVFNELNNSKKLK
ncbi:IS630 family transposase [Mucilaginibacter sp. BJC16-A38]|uniref:IS630 family transposase n=1 Tax=Mucilaginibacter phenanthrenivorans TaxID=1234842 RepID=UPI0021579AF6|nr:IS630 family transposase [Mucilaginibacter phenanthrenivorans]MCR8560158.1 IS630 family transposase [Mucilaginibacter phenanthrenivorans]